MRKRENFEALFNAARVKDSDLNDDGTTTTKHGRHVIPFKAEFKDTDAGGIRPKNLFKFLSQSRVKEIRAQVAEVNYANGQNVILDTDTGDFYLKDKEDSAESVFQKSPLGQIDIETETSIFRVALQLHRLDKVMDNGSSADTSDTRAYPCVTPSSFLD